MNDVVITNYLRSAQTRSRPSTPEKDWFHSIRGDDILAKIIPKLLEDGKTDSKELGDMIVGSALGVTEQWTFGGRTNAMLANLSSSVPTRFVDQQCGAGMAAIQIGFMEIATGCIDIALSCGVEHMTRVPIGPTLFTNGTMSINNKLYKDKVYDRWEMDTIMNMGLTAEKLAVLTGISREEMDHWSVRSHKRACEASKNGFFAGEILPIDIQQEEGKFTTINQDQNIRHNADFESTNSLKPAFREDGVISAGNSSPLSSGAGAMLLMSAEKASEKHLLPMAKIRSIGFSGVDPTLMGLGPIPATKMALKKAGLQPDDIDIWEINEAFSVVVLNTINEFKLNPENVNIHGGGIALGHPLGATGIRMVGTLARILNQKKRKYGCATACVGGGQGVAVIIENESLDVMGK